MKKGIIGPLIIACLFSYLISIVYIQFNIRRFDSMCRLSLSNEQNEKHKIINNPSLKASIDSLRNSRHRFSRLYSFSVVLSNS